MKDSVNSFNYCTFEVSWHFYVPKKKGSFMAFLCTKLNVTFYPHVALYSVVCNPTRGERDTVTVINSAARHYLHH